MRIFSVVLALAFAAPAFSQVLFTGATSGKGNGSVYLFGTAQRTDGTHAATNWSAVVLGVHKRFDVVFGGGDTTTLGRHVPFAAAGSVVGLPTQKFGFDAMVFHLVSFPARNLCTCAPGRPHGHERSLVGGSAHEPLFICINISRQKI